MRKYSVPRADEHCSVSYKGSLEVAGGLPPENRADSDKELLAIVARVLKSSHVLSAAQSLIARASDALGEEVQQPDSSQSSSAESSTVYEAKAEAENTDDHVFGRDANATNFVLRGCLCQRGADCQSQRVPARDRPLTD